MAQLIFEIPDDQIAHVIDMQAIHFGYQETILTDGVESPNPETKQVFVHKSLANWALSTTKAMERQQKLKEAEQNMSITNISIS